MDLLGTIFGAVITAVGFTLTILSFRADRRAEAAERYDRRAGIIQRDIGYIDILNELKSSEALAARRTLESGAQQERSEAHAYLRGLHDRVFAKTELLKEPEPSEPAPSPGRLRRTWRAMWLLDGAASPLPDGYERHRAQLLGDMEEALGDLGKALDAHRTTPTTDAGTARPGARDHSRWRWEDHGRYTKLQVLQQAARRFADSRNITSRAEFESEWAAELARVRPADQTVPGQGLVFSPAEFDRTHRNVAEASGTLHLDGQEYVIDWRMGYPVQQYGVLTHLPAIEHFRREGYPISPAP